MIRSRYSIALLGAVFIGSLTLSTPARAWSLFDALFGESDSSSGAQAPKVDPESMKNSPIMQMYGQDRASVRKNALDIDQPDRSPEEIAEWAGAVVVQALTLSPATYQKTLGQIGPNFAPYGLKEYQDYIGKVGLIETLTKSNMRVQAITEGSPQVIRDGLVSGSYHWLVQVPLMITFYNDAVRKIEDKNAALGQNQKMTIQVQVGRTPKKDSASSGVAIERWVVITGQK